MPPSEGMTHDIKVTHTSLTCTLIIIDGYNLNRKSQIGLLIVTGVYIWADRNATLHASITASAGHDTVTHMTLQRRDF